MRNGVAGVGTSAGSSDWDRTRGVAFSVPQVINCFTAAGPSSDGVGDGTEGTRDSNSFAEDFGRSGAMQQCRSPVSRSEQISLTRCPGYSSVYATTGRTRRRGYRMVRLVVLLWKPCIPMFDSFRRTLRFLRGVRFRCIVRRDVRVWREHQSIPCLPTQATLSIFRISSPF